MVIEKGRKGQAAMEYLLIVGLAFVILTPMLYMFYDYTSTLRRDVNLAKVYKIGGTMVNTAEQMYYLGEPSKTTIRFNMPDGVVDVTVRGTMKDILVFHFGDQANYEEIVIPGNVPMISLLTTSDFTPGIKVISVEATANEVLFRRAT
ncbi:hypothetical protein HY488_02755 [Candidatus Woesearchaeota archaeon]|nr:hypothetical protein [Candidatus Woesearchaeota archaeon]